MSAQTLIRFVGSLALAAMATAGSYYFDRERSLSFENEASLRWARQVTTQLESMSLTAREKGEEDPLGFAVDFLTQGIDPRLLRVTKLPPESPQSLNPETYSLDRASGIFDYSKVLTPEDRAGVRIQFDAGAAGFIPGFLGTRSPFAQDALLATLFSMVFSLGYLSTRPRRSAGTRPSKILDEAFPLQLIQGAPDIGDWHASSKTSLTTLGTRVRDLLKHAQGVTGAARQSREHAKALRTRIHGGIKDLHSSRRDLKKAVKLATQGAALAQDPTLSALLADIRAACERGDQAVVTLEQSLEPWSTDADLALESFDGVTQASKEMAAQIQGAKECLVEQAKLLQELGRRLKKDAGKAA